MFIFPRPLSAVLAALATSGLLVFVDFIARGYAHVLI
jgi:hypothetical protein